MADELSATYVRRCVKVMVMLQNERNIVVELNGFNFNNSNTFIKKKETVLTYFEYFHHMPGF